MPGLVESKRIPGRSGLAGKHLLPLFQTGDFLPIVAFPRLRELVFILSLISDNQILLCPVKFDLRMDQLDFHGQNFRFHFRIHRLRRVGPTLTLLTPQDVEIIPQFVHGFAARFNGRVEFGYPPPRALTCPDLSLFRFKSFLGQWGINLKLYRSVFILEKLQSKRWIKRKK